MIVQLYEKFRPWSETGTVWLYSDPHFGDEELRSLVPSRPTDEEQVRLINSKVGRKDTLILLGDVGDIEYAKKLRGYKVLIMGNHDAGVSNYQKRYYYENIFTKERVYKDENPGYFDTISINGFADMVLKDNGLFDEVYAGPLIVGEKILLSHEPIAIPGFLNIHGHIHHPLVKANHPNQLNCCSDAIKYTPINMNQLMKSGILGKVETVHRATIDKATKRARKRGKK